MRYVIPASSQLSGRGLQVWKMLLHLHVNKKKHDDDDDDDDDDDTSLFLSINLSKSILKYNPKGG